MRVNPPHPAAARPAASRREGRAPPLPQEAHLGLEAHAELALYLVLDVLNHGMNVGRGRPADVHDEARVLARDLGTSHAVALQAGVHDELAREVALGTLER